MPISMNSQFNATYSKLLKFDILLLRQVVAFKKKLFCFSFRKSKPMVLKSQGEKHNLKILLFVQPKKLLERSRKLQFLIEKY